MSKKHRSYVVIYFLSTLLTNGACWSAIANKRATSVLKSVPGDNNELPITSLLLQVSYDGEGFVGWTAGSADDGESRTVKGVLQSTFSRIFGDVDPSLIGMEGCCSTGKGVHATHMIAQVYCISPEWEIQVAGSAEAGTLERPSPQSAVDTAGFVPFRQAPAQVQHAVNMLLPDDIRITRVGLYPAPQEYAFHPTLDAMSQTYQYKFSFGPMHDPMQHRCVWHIDSAVNIDALERAAIFCTGTHDFAAFTGDSEPTTADTSTECEVESISVIYDPSPNIPQLITFTAKITANRFLPEMAQHLVAAMVEVGKGNLEVRDIVDALKNGNFGRDPKPQPAPALGLSLVGVSYNRALDWEY